MTGRAFSDAMWGYVIARPTAECYLSAVKGASALAFKTTGMHDAKIGTASRTFGCEYCLVVSAGTHCQGCGAPHPRPEGARKRSRHEISELLQKVI